MRAQAQIAVAYGLDSASKPNRLYVTIDGVMVRELDGWNETKVSAIGMTQRSDARGNCGVLFESHRGATCLV